MKSIFVFGVATFALSLLSSATQSSQAAANTPARAQPQHAGDQQLAKVSKEAEGKAAEGDETAQFKQSPSVQWLAKKLGISVERAYLGSVLLNFAIIAGLVAYGLKKFLPSALRARTESINKSLAEAQRASDDANQRLREIETKLTRLGSEIAALQASTTAQAQEEEGRLRASAEEERQRIVSGAEQEIAAASANARRQLRSYAAGLAVDLAEKKISIDAPADQVLVRDFADQLGRNGHD